MVVVVHYYTAIAWLPQPYCVPWSAGSCSFQRALGVAFGAWNGWHSGAPVVRSSPLDHTAVDRSPGCISLSAAEGKGASEVNCHRAAIESNSASVNLVERSRKAPEATPSYP